jgi:hypothetical protein
MSAGLLLYQQSTERNAHSTVLGYGMREATNVAHACLVRWFSEGGDPKRRSLEEMVILGRRRRHFPWRAAKERHCWEIRQTGRVCALSLSLSCWCWSSACAPQRHGHRDLRNRSIHDERKAKRETGETWGERGRPSPPTGPTTPS